MAKISPLEKLKAKTADMKIPMFQQEAFIKANLIILPELRDLIPPLRSDESLQLETNLMINGIKDPLAVWETTPEVIRNGARKGSDSEQVVRDLADDVKIYVLIDGHNRYHLAQKHKLDYRINIDEFTDLESVRAYMIDYQLGRRNLTPQQTSYLRGHRYNKLREDNRFGRELNVAEKLAEEFKVSARTIKRDSSFAEGLDNLALNLKQEVLAGQITLPKGALKILARNVISKPIKSVSELDVFLDTISKASANNSGSKAKLGAPEHDASGRETVLSTKSGANDETGRLQLELRRFLNEDSSNRETLQELIEKANELLNTLK